MTNNHPAELDTQRDEARDDAMDTGEEALPELGKTALITKFGKSCRLANLITKVGEGYSETLLSNRLTGRESKEGLLITIAFKHLRDEPGKPLPYWYPKTLSIIPEQALKDRCDFLPHKSLRPTRDEKRGLPIKLHAGVSEGMKKRKLSDRPKDDTNEPRRPRSSQPLP